MRKRTRSIIVGAIVGLVWAALAAFTTWGRHPSDWAEESRFAWALIGTMFVGLAYLISNNSDE